MNLLPVTVGGGGLVTVGGRTITLAAAGTRAIAGMSEALLGVRPEHLLWHTGSDAPLLSGHAVVVEPLGSDTLVSLDIAGTPIIVRLPPRLVRKAGEAVSLIADPANLHFFDRTTGRRL